MNEPMEEGCSNSAQDRATTNGNANRSSLRTIHERTKSMAGYVKLPSHVQQEDPTKAQRTFQDQESERSAHVSIGTSQNMEDLRFIPPRSPIAISRNTTIWT